MTRRIFVGATVRDAYAFVGANLGGIIGGEQVAGSMNTTFQTIDPGSQEVLATVSEMGEAEVARAVAAADRATSIPRKCASA